jgi:GntR family transcriptional regulator/MocR family aminotransferase
VRLGWITAPLDFVEPLREQKSGADSGSPALDQLALAHLMRNGDYERHVVQARRGYRRRRDRLVAAVTARLPGLELTGAAAGMQLLLKLPDDVDDLELVEAASARGVNISALSPLYLTAPPKRGLLLGFGRLPEPSIEKAVEALATAVAPRLGHRHTIPYGARL